MRILLLNDKYNKFTITEETVITDRTDRNDTKQYITWIGSFNIGNKIKEKEIFLLLKYFKCKIIYFGKISITGCSIKTTNKKIFNYEFIGNGQLYKESW